MTDDRNHKVIDISHWQTIPSSLIPAKESGVLGVIHKATEGAGGYDDKYPARRFLAREAGLLFGAYHFLRPGSMADQARIFVEYCDPQPWTLLAADHEDERVSLDDLVEWLAAVETLIGIRPVIYSGHVLKEQLGGQRHPVLNEQNFPLWLAQYSSEPELPAGWSAAWLWQWTDRGEVPGIDPPTDLNHYAGDDRDLIRSWVADAINWTPPGPAPEPPTAEGQLTPIGFQQALAAGGYYGGEIDGLSGPATRAAVDDWFADGEPLDLVTGEKEDG